MQPATRFNLTKKQILITIGVILVLILLSVGNVVRNSIGFKVISTNPKMGHVAAVSPYIVFGFNKELSSKGVSVSSSPINFIASTKVNGKNLQVNIRSLNKNQKYSITLKSVSSTTGNKLTNKTFTFTAQDISYDDLDGGAQQAIIANQDQFTYTVDTYAFDGLSSVVDDAGLSSQQEQALRQAVFNYSQQLKKQFGLVTLYKESLQDGPNNPTTGGGTIYFTLGIDGKNYSAQMDHWDLTIMRLYLRDPQTNAVLFDSGDIDGMNLE
jgi:hypothetical protein